MKKIIFKLSVIIVLLLITNSPVWSQPPPPANHSETGNAPPGGGAPIGSGTQMLVILAALYGSRKVYLMSNSKEKEA